jgi:hypothetical protein
LDRRIEWALQNDISVLLTIQSNGPQWVCHPVFQNERSCVFTDPDRFKQYITSLLSRYSNQIDKLQFGNEWASEYWYTGSAEEFTLFHNILYDAIQQVSPQTRVVLGGLSTSQLRRLAFCDGLVEEYKTIDGELVSAADSSYCVSEDYKFFRQRFEYVIENARYDLVDFHFYDDVENWPMYYQAAAAYFPGDLEVVVSEFGGPNLFTEQPYSDEYQAGRLAEYISTLNQIGVDEAYFFKLVQSDSAHPSHRQSGLFREEDGELVPKPAFYLFRQYSLGAAP